MSIFRLNIDYVACEKCGLQLRVSTGKNKKGASVLLAEPCDGCLCEKEKKTMQFCQEMNKVVTE